MFLFQDQIRVENDEQNVRLEILESTTIQMDKNMKNEILGVSNKIDGIDVKVKGNHVDVRAINDTLDGLKIAPIGKMIFHI